MWLTAGTSEGRIGKFLQQHNTKNLCQYIPYIMKYQITTWLTSDIPLNSSKFIDNLAKYEKQYSPWWDAITTASSRLQHHKNLP